MILTSDQIAVIVIVIVKVIVINNYSYSTPGIIADYFDFRSDCREKINWLSLRSRASIFCFHNGEGNTKRFNLLNPRKK